MDRADVADVADRAAVWQITETVLQRAGQLAQHRTEQQSAHLAALAAARGQPGTPALPATLMAGGVDGDPYWVTVQALHQRQRSEQRALLAVRCLLSELRGGAPALPGQEWGRTAEGLRYWMRRDGWRPADPGTALAVSTRLAHAQAQAGLWCEHCGKPGLELHVFVRGNGKARAQRAFSRCGRCGLVAEHAVSLRATACGVPEETVKLRWGETPVVGGSRWRRHDSQLPAVSGARTPLRRNDRRWWPSIPVSHVRGDAHGP